MKANRRSGLTLIEVIIASAILAIVVAITMSVLTSGSRTASSGQLLSQLEQRGNRTLAFCRDQMSTAAYTHPTFTTLGMVPGTFNTAIGYQVSGPATVGPTGTPTLVFGYVDPRIAVDPVVQPVNPNLACFLRFEADTVYLESSASPMPTQAGNWVSPALPAYPVLPSSDPTKLIVRTLNMDIKGNGLRTATYVSGRLMKYVVDMLAGTVVGREKLDDQVILCVSGTGPGDFAGTINQTPDGSNVGGIGSGLATGVILPDLLFVFTDSNGVPQPGMTGANANGLLINLWHGCIDEDGKRFLLRNNRLLIHIRAELKKG